MHPQQVIRTHHGVRGIKTHGLAALICACLLPGCARYHARPLVPDQVATGFESRSLADPALRVFLETNGLGGEWPRAAWDLESLTLAALYFHPDLEVARAKAAAFDAAQGTAAQRPNPTLAVAPAYNSTRSTPSPWIVTVNLDIPIETAGKRAHRKERARRLSEAARLGMAAEAWRVRGRLRAALVDFHAAYERERLLASQQSAQAQLTDLFEAQRQAGAVSSVETAKERIALHAIRLAVLEAGRRRAEARVSLAGAIGLPAKALEHATILTTGLEALPPEWTEPAARRLALVNRADVLVALAEYAASEAALRLEIAKQYPDIHLSPGYEFDQEEHKWGLGLGVDLPVFHQNQGAIAEAEAKRVELAAQFNALQARVLEEIELALSAYQAARERSVVAETLMVDLEAQERLLRAQFEEGSVARGDWVASSIELMTARLARSDTTAEAQRAMARLEEALQRPLTAMKRSEAQLRSALTGRDPWPTSHHGGDQRE